MRSRFLGMSVLAIALVACSGGAATQAPTVAPTSAPTTAASDAPASPATGSGDVQLGDSDFGQIVVDAEGMTLYGFVPDEATGEPTCYDDCATAWPPLLAAEEIVVGEGLDETEFTNGRRAPTVPATRSCSASIRSTTSPATQLRATRRAGPW